MSHAQQLSQHSWPCDPPTQDESLHWHLLVGGHLLVGVDHAAQHADQQPVTAAAAAAASRHALLELAEQQVDLQDRALTPEHHAVLQAPDLGVSARPTLVQM